MSVEDDALWVYADDVKVGVLYDRNPLAFAYDPAWLSRADGFQIGAIGLATGLQQGAAVEACFENLLPEGDVRQYLTARHQTSTLFGLLQALAGDSAGGLVLLPPGQKPASARYVETSWSAIASTLKRAGASAIDLHPPGVRISLAGAQDKATLAIFDGVPMLPEGNSPSTHILKPDIYRLKKVWESAANEAIIMQTAAYCGLVTAPVFYEPETHACVVERFDRQVTGPRQLLRLPQYDFCQLAGIPSDLKYEQEGGPGIAACAALIRQYSGTPASDLRRFVEWIFFNLYSGNNDSHAKNLSMYRGPDGTTQLTPHYDLMCTRLYPGLSQRFAFRIGEHERPGDIDHADVTAMAHSIGMQPAFVHRLAAQLAQRMPDAVDRSVDALAPVLSHNGKRLAEQLSKTVKSYTRRIAKRLAHASV